MANVSDLRITPHVECLAGADFARCDFGRAGVGRDCHQHGERLRRRQSGPGVSGQPEPVFADGSAGASLNWAGQNTTAAAVAPGGLTDFDAAIGSNAIGGVVTRNGETYVMNAVQSATGNDNATITLSSITDWIVGGVLNSIKFLGNEAAQAMDTTVPASTSARAMSTIPVPFVGNDGNPILNQQDQPMMMPANADPSAVTDIGSSLALAGADPSNPAAGSELAVEQLALFRQKGAWDFQRVGPSQTFVAAFTDYANVEIEAYAASIEMSLSDVLSISNLYGEYFSKFSPDSMDTAYPYLRNTNVWDITHGYSLYQDGIIGHH